MDNNFLWNKYKTTHSPEVKKEIILNYVNLVHYVIHNTKLINYGIFEDRDYFQYGIEGLSEAIDRFNPDYGTKFETYAIQRIRGKIIDEIRKVNAKQRVYQSENLNDIYSQLSLNSAFNAEESCQLYEVIPDNVETPDKILESNEIKEELKKQLKALNERDRLIITLYYYEGLNYKEIAKVLGITVSRVSQVHTKIINTLKKKLAYMNV
ncbi:sigma-70 family RNA polymerase sigma factor [Melioribacteraceae bacterium 4301-Me]|uniref:sigma-70 family RNA polymerase sigma factor n=1 Tax=Pyranulibacter aquaticus TaxID=3163344 RepID=UPI0035972B95